MPPKASAAAVPPANVLGEDLKAPAVEKKSRVQLASVLGINISQARVATHLKHDLGDEAIEAEIKVLRKDLKAAKEAGDIVAEASIKDSIAEKSKALVRVSSETPIAAAVIWDGAVKELISSGMDQAIAGDRKIVEVCHVHDGLPDALLYYPLYDKCEIWASYNPEHEDELKKIRAATNKAAKEAREAKKAADAAAGATPAKGAKVAPAKAPVAEAKEAEHQTKTTFYTYVENALKTVKKEERYKSMRVSNRVREYLSELVAQGIARMAALARIVVQQVMGVRTMNAGHVRAVVHMLMSDSGRTAEQIGEVTSKIDEKLQLYHNHLDSEKAKKLAALDDKARLGLAHKKLEVELARKKKQAGHAKTRAIEAANRAKTLAAETVKLEPIVAANRAADAADTGSA